MFIVFSEVTLLDPPFFQSSSAFDSSSVAASVAGAVSVAEED